MVEFKLVISDPKTGKTYQKALSEADSEKLIGHRIKDKIKGDLIDINGYELEIRGGSDYCGFPLRSTLRGSARKKVLLRKGPGVKIKTKGMLKRKTVVGNTISHRTTQINLKVLSYGSKKLNEIFGVKEEVKEEKIEKKPKKEMVEEKKVEGHEGR